MGLNEILSRLNELTDLRTDLHWCCHAGASLCHLKLSWYTLLGATQQTDIFGLVKHVSTNDTNSSENQISYVRQVTATFRDIL